MQLRKGETTLRFFDIIVSSKELKKLISERAKELDVKLFHVVRHAGINWGTFKLNYLYAEDILSGPSIRQEHILKVCKTLGINARMTLTIVDPDPKVLHELRNKDYER